MAVESVLTRDEMTALFNRRQEAFDNMDTDALSRDYADDCIVDSPAAGTLRGDIGGFRGLDPSGKSFKAPAVFVYEFRDRKIIRETRIYDFTGVLIQIGLLKAKPS